MKPVMQVESVMPDSSRSRLTLNILAGEPAILARMAQRQIHGNWLLLFPFICLMLAAVAASSAHAFIQAQLGSLLCHDFSVYIKASRWHCVQTQGQALADISLVRDLPSLLAVVFLSLTPWLIYRQWTGIETFLDQMNSANLLSFPLGVEKVTARIQKCNRFFVELSDANALTMLAAVIFVLLVACAQARFGVYGLLGSQYSVASSYSEWWASLLRSPASWLLYVIVGSLGVYTILLQNIFGGRTVLLVWQLRKEVRYLADPDNLDGHYGWSGVRQILQATWLSLMLHGLALILVDLSLARSAALYLLPLLGQWLIAAPLYVGIPVYLIRRDIVKFKAEEQAKLRAEHALAEDFAQREAIARRADRVRAIPVVPFVKAGEKTLVLIGLVASIATMIQLAWLVYFTG